MKNYKLTLFLFLFSARIFSQNTANDTVNTQTEETFDWLYLDYNTLQNAAIDNGLNCELIQEGEHFDYLARLFV